MHVHSPVTASISIAAAPHLRGTLLTEIFFPIIGPKRGRPPKLPSQNELSLPGWALNSPTSVGTKRKVTANRGYATWWEGNPSVVGISRTLSQRSARLAPRSFPRKWGSVVGRATIAARYKSKPSPTPAVVPPPHPPLSRRPGQLGT